MHQRHAHNRTPAYFHTGSMAEYHEYHLRCILATYVSALTNDSEGDSAAAARRIMTDDRLFVDAVQRYKHVVTHYFASKTEIWMALYMKPVFGVVGGSLANEFAPSRGCIHFHSVLQAEHSSLKVCREALAKYSSDVYEAMKSLDRYIATNYDVEAHKDKFPIRPDSIYNTNGIDVREAFCKVTQGGNIAFEEYKDVVSNSHKLCEASIGKELMSSFGYNACHTGKAPSDYIYPVGLMYDDYRTDKSNMQGKDDVIARGELKRKPWDVDRLMGIARTELNEISSLSSTKYEAHSNMLNHAFTHSCSSYCLRDKKVQVSIIC